MGTSWTLDVPGRNFFARKIDDLSHSGAVIRQEFRSNQNALSCKCSKHPELTPIVEHDSQVRGGNSVGRRYPLRRAIYVLYVVCRMLAWYTCLRTAIIPSISCPPTSTCREQYSSWQRFWKSCPKASDNVDQKTTKNNVQLKESMWYRIFGFAMQALQLIPKKQSYLFSNKWSQTTKESLRTSQWIMSEMEILPAQQGIDKTLSYSTTQLLWAAPNQTCFLITNLYCI